jgi:flagellar biosynthesis protein FliP
MSDMTSALGIIFTVLLLTSFVKIVTSLTIFRVGIGLNQSGFGIVIIAVSLALSMMVMSPQISALGGMNSIFSGKLPKQEIDYQKNFMPFLEKNSDPQITGRLEKFSKAADKEKPAFEVVISSFMLTELKEAFQIGLIILIPFLVIDLLVANALILLGANQLSPELVSLPLKIIVFFAVDGWTLLAEKLLRTYL